MGAGSRAFNPKGPSAQIIGFQGPKTHSEYGFGDLKPYYLGTRTHWVKKIRGLGSEPRGPSSRAVSWDLQSPRWGLQPAFSFG